MTLPRIPLKEHAVRMISGATWPGLRRIWRRLGGEKPGLRRTRYLPCLTIPKNIRIQETNWLLVDLCNLCKTSCREVSRGILELVLLIEIKHEQYPHALPYLSLLQRKHLSQSQSAVGGLCSQVPIWCHLFPAMEKSIQRNESMKGRKISCK